MDASPIEDKIYIGYHGTDATLVESICANNFNVSNDDEWIGDGAYFFVEGLSDPCDSAKNWAISQSHKRQEDGVYKRLHTHYAVMEAMVVVNAKNVLDLSTTEGKIGFNRYKTVLAEDANRRGKKLKKKYEHTDSAMINSLSKTYSLDVVIAELYIKTDKAQLKQALVSRISNKTVLAVRNPKKCIDEDCILERDRGEIEQWT